MILKIAVHINDINQDIKRQKVQLRGTHGVSGIKPLISHVQDKYSHYCPVYGPAFPTYPFQQTG